MLEFTSQSTASKFPASQGLLKTPSQVCSVAACGWAFSRCEPQHEEAQCNHIPPARVGVSVGYIGVRVGLVGVRVGSARLFGYQHVGIGNAKRCIYHARLQCKWVRILMEYRSIRFCIYIGKKEVKCFY